MSESKSCPFDPICELKKLISIKQIETENSSYDSQHGNDNTIYDIENSEVFNDFDSSSFELAQAYFERKEYVKAWELYKTAYFNDLRAKYQTGVILFDELITESISNFENQKTKACEIFEEIVELHNQPNLSDNHKDIVYFAAYNLGNAYYYGLERRQSTDKAIEYFLLAAKHGNQEVATLAQTALGYAYSGSDIRDYEKSVFWHYSAYKNGSIESQASLGVMHLHGLGVKTDWQKAHYHLTASSSKGSLYGSANLVYLYYKRKLFTNVCFLASRLIHMDSNDLNSKTEKHFKISPYRAMSMIYFLYGLCLRNGTGVQKNEKLAYDLFYKSVKNDHKLAAKFCYMVIHGEL